MAEKSKQKVEKEAEQRRDAGITRMLNTPPKPHKEMKKGKPHESKKSDAAKGAADR